MPDTLFHVAVESWQVLGQMAPYLLLGFFVAGVLSVCISPAWVERHLGRRGWGPVLKASLFGVPLPLCSCGVIPVSASIRRHGASRAATTAFLLSTPQTGVDSIAVTYAMLGPVFAVFRPIAALLTGLVGGGLVQLFDEPAAKGAGVPTRNGSNELPDNRPAADTGTDAGYADKGKRSALWRVLQYGFVILPRDIASALVVGILIAGVMAALMPQGHLHAYLGGGVLSIVLLVAAGVPIYVCATASVPIAAGFVHLGASPGAALAFLIAGPATNAATLTTVWRVLGRRTAVLYLTTIAVSAVACGLLLDQLMPAGQAAVPQLARHTHAAEASSWFQHAAAVALLAVLLFSYLLKTRDATAPRPQASVRAAPRAPQEAESPDRASAEQRLELRVTGMTCSHCAETVQRALAECPRVRSAAVDLAHDKAVVEGNNLDPDALVAAVTGLGYRARVAGGP